jgi:hypothetical protein
VLRRAGLLDGYRGSPDATIAALRALAISRGMEWPDLFALSELSYVRGRETGAKSRFLATVLYAYAVLFPESGGDRPSPYAPEFLQAANFYNLALTQALTTPSGEVALASGRFELPFGSLDLTVDADSMRVDRRDLVSFVPTMNLEVKGFQNNYRNSGIGAPMAASLTAHIGPQSGLFLPPHLRIPTSAVLQLRQPRRQLSGASLKGTLTVHTIFDGLATSIAGQDVPLEFDQTAVRALFLTEGEAWSNEVSGLFNNDRIPAGNHLGAIEPHRRGRIPVVLVHGTAARGAQSLPSHARASGAHLMPCISPAAPLPSTARASTTCSATDASAARSLCPSARTTRSSSSPAPVSPLTPATTTT